MQEVNGSDHLVDNSVSGVFFNYDGTSTDVLPKSTSGDGGNMNPSVSLFDGTSTIFLFSAYVVITIMLCLG